MGTVVPYSFKMKIASTYMNSLTSMGDVTSWTVNLEYVQVNVDLNSDDSVNRLMT